MRLALLALLAAPAWAEPPSLPADEAYALVRGLMLDFESPPEQLVMHLSSAPDRPWLTFPAKLDVLDDPLAIGAIRTYELEPDQSMPRAPRRASCLRVGPKTVAALRDRGRPLPAIDAEISEVFDLLTLMVRASATEPLSPVMYCHIALTLTVTDPVAAFARVAGSDFASARQGHDGAITLTDGQPGPDGKVELLNITAPGGRYGPGYLFLNAFSLMAPSGF